MDFSESANLELFDPCLPVDQSLEEDVNGWSFKVRAHCARSRHQARRAKSETAIASVLPPDIADGECWHVISSGDVDSLSFVAHLIKQHRMDYVAFSTWCMAVTDINQLGEWLLTDRIGRLDAYVGEIFPGTYAKEFVALRKIVTPCAGRVAVFRNHSKVFLMRSKQRAWVIESSANINTNPRTENTCITADMDLFLHHKAYFDSVRSFDKQFPDWQPA